MTFEEHRAWVEDENAKREQSGGELLPKLAISFSGGRTSAVMTKKLWDAYSDKRDILITFANTGCEHKATLDFVNECAVRFGWPVVWLEAVVNMERGKENRNGGRERAHFFREHMSTMELRERAATTVFREYTDDAYGHGWEPGLDFSDGSCGESCEIGADLEY